MRQGNAKDCERLLKRVRTVACPVVDLEFVRQTAPLNGLAKAKSQSFVCFAQKKLGTNDAPRMVVHDGNQIRFSFSTTGDLDHRAVHHVALPDVVWELRLELASVDVGNSRLRKSLILNEPVN